MRLRDAEDRPDGDVAAPTPPAAEAAEPATGPPRSEAPADLARHEYYANELRNNSAAIWHHAALATKIRGVDPQSYILYHERLRADCGGPTDPIEVMLIEEIAQAHACLGLLFAKTSNGGHVEAVGIYAGATARLMAEVRRSALALQAYRAASRQLAVPGSENILIAPGASPGLNDQSREKSSTTELESTGGDGDDERPVIPMPRAATS